MSIITATIGYHRIGKLREVKKALESFWRNELPSEELLQTPVIPTVEKLIQQLKTGISTLPLQQIWVNPDCGLKTRRWQEVIPSLKNMVEATRKVREEIDLSTDYQNP